MTALNYDPISTSSKLGLNRAPGARLGCGEGTLLKFLRDQKQVRGYGLEIDDDKITRCIAKGVNVIEQDLNKA